MKNTFAKAGEKHNRLTLVEKHPSKPRLWLCQCDCGNRGFFSVSNLRNGHTKSCGCLKAETLIKHGHSPDGKQSRTYKTWDCARSRCFNPKATGYNYYGGRGITMCHRWRSDFKNFLADMGVRPEGMSLDRIDSDGNYEPGNCRWANHLTQMHNSSVYKYDDFDRQLMSRWKSAGFSLKEISLQFGIGYSYVSKLIRAERLIAAGRHHR